MQVLFRNRKSEDEKKKTKITTATIHRRAVRQKGSSSKGSSISASLPPVPSDNVPETVVPDTEKKADFADLTGFDWAKDAVDYLYQKGIVSGRNEKEFAPSDFVTREEFVKNGNLRNRS
ncbi:MAG: S-layer homology domain-containing protein [Clostridiales bacterium]|nr:MAG: S-layer homology domain-containing protein [Clostridiales bacterium]